MGMAPTGNEGVFGTGREIRAAISATTAAVTFLVAFGAAWVGKPSGLDDLIGGTILFNRQRLKLPIDAGVTRLALVLSLAVAAATGASMTASWTTLALFWQAPHSAAMPDPVFGRPVGFYLFVLAAWQLLSGCLLPLSAIATPIAVAWVTVRARPT